MKAAVGVALIIGVMAAMILLRGLLIWIAWDWFGYVAVNLAVPPAHAQPIDLWAAIGLATIAQMLAGAATSSSDKK